MTDALAYPFGDDGGDPEVEAVDQGDGEVDEGDGPGVAVVEKTDADPVEPEQAEEEAAPEPAAAIAAQEQGEKAEGQEALEEAVRQPPMGQVEEGGAGEGRQQAPC